jgi:hypothetical protein
MLRAWIEGTDKSKATRSIRYEFHRPRSVQKGVRQTQETLEILGFFFSKAQDFLEVYLNR